MTIVMRGSPAGGDSPQDNVQQQQQQLPPTQPQPATVLTQTGQPITTQPSISPPVQQTQSHSQQPLQEHQVPTCQVISMPSTSPLSSMVTQSGMPLVNQSIPTPLEEGGQGDGDAALPQVIYIYIYFFSPAH